ncbi:MAG: hypothetical protein GY929_14380, partial [Actinomycetia bacterium]|nr:hypothetical protein [Actinomycetes bacterium]
MVDLDELGARVRTQTSAPAPSVGEIAARAVRRRQRRLATRLGSVAAVVVVLVGVVWAVGSREEPASVITVPQSPRSLGAGRVVWPDESLSYADVEGLAAGFRDEFLGEGWTFTVSEVNEVEVYVSFTGPNGEYLLGSAEAFELGVAFTSVNTDRSLVLGADGTVSVEDREGGLPATVDIFHRPHGSHSTLSTSDQPVTGPWVLPGADEVGEVGTVLVIERGETGEVLAVRGSAIDGVGTTVNFGDLGVSVPAAEAQSIFGPAVDSDGWVNVRQ